MTCTGDLGCWDPPQVSPPAPGQALLITSEPFPVSQEKCLFSSLNKSVAGLRYDSVHVNQVLPY